MKRISGILLLLGFGCGDDKSVTTTSSGGDEMEMTTGGETTGGTTGGGTTGGGTTEAICTLGCDKFVQCGLSPDTESCVSSCLVDIEAVSSECLAANEAFVGCVVTMTCAELLELLFEVDPGKCAEPYDALSLYCDAPCASEQLTDGQECSAKLECADAPALEMRCDPDECVCLIDGVPSGVSCPSDLVCAEDLAVQDAKAIACCGFSTDDGSADLGATTGSVSPYYYRQLHGTPWPAGVMID